MITGVVIADVVVVVPIASRIRAGGASHDGAVGCTVTINDNEGDGIISIEPDNHEYYCNDCAHHHQPQQHETDPNIPPTFNRLAGKLIIRPTTSISSLSILVVVVLGLVNDRSHSPSPRHPDSSTLASMPATSSLLANGRQ